MNHWSEGDVVVNDVRIHYHRTGNQGAGGGKPSLVLCHGITDNGLCWRRVATALESKFDIIMVDARGHGQSDAPDGSYHADAHAADVVGLIASLGLQKPLLMGHSMGGATVATLAANYPAIPSRVVLEDPPWRMEASNPEEQVKRMAEWREMTIKRQQTKSQAEIIEEGRAVNPKWDESEFQFWSLAKKMVSPKVFGFGIAAPPAIQWRNLVGKITCPTLLVGGDPELGGIIDAACAQFATAANPQIQFAHVANAGHNIRRDQFQPFVDQVSKFL